MESLLLTIQQFKLVLVGLGLMLGLVSRHAALRRVAMILVVAPIILSVGLQSAQAGWQGLSFTDRFQLLGVGLPLIAGVLLFGTAFGREVFASILGNAAYDGLRSKGCVIGCLPLMIIVVLLCAVLA